MADPTPFRLRPAIIAIDGPAASGKSTIGHELAGRLGFLFFDTGVMYRAVTWAALARGVALDSESEIGLLAETLHIDVQEPVGEQADGRHLTVLVDGEDVTWRLRSADVDRAVSLVSAYARVRRALAAHQRRIGLGYGAGRNATGNAAGIVMVGRDIGTEVLPEAPLKVFLDASPEERARRRHAELLERDKDVPYSQLLAEIVARDAFDSGRAVSPLRPATDAVILDTTSLTPGQVVERILALATEPG